jgi:hypothetical protein
MVYPEDNEAFLRSLERFILAYGYVTRPLRFKVQLDGLFNRLAQWLLVPENHQRICGGRAFLSMHDGKLRFLVVGFGTKYDDILEDSLTELIIAVARSRGTRMLRFDASGVPETFTVATPSSHDPSLMLEFCRTQG